MVTKFCGRLDPHDSHTIRVENVDDWDYWARRDTDICPGEPLIEGGAECVLHQAPLAHCQCREERMKRWST